MIAINKEQAMHTRWKRRFWIVPPVLIAVFILVMAPQMKRPPQKVEVSERAVKAMVIKASRLPVIPKAIGYGMTKAARSWEAVAEVSGQVTWVSDELKSGNMISQGTELLHIDNSSYQLALTQAITQLNSLKVKDHATDASLKLEKRSHSLLKKNIERKRKLLKKGIISSSEFEEAERGFWESELSVQNLKNSLAINNAERELLKIQKERAELDLQRTRLIAPFDVRVTSLKINQKQYANKGQLLFSADDIAKVEIEARFPIGKLRPLIEGKSQEQDDDEETDALERVPGAKKLDALVRLRTATHAVEWAARVDRVAGVIDLETQTIGVVVVVDNPYEQARPGKRPPLVRNTFVEVELRKKTQGRLIVIPTSALQNGKKVYVVDQEQRLELRSVKTMLIQDGVAVIAKGIEEGEKIVVSKLVPAIEGMLLDPVEDKKVMKRLKIEAAGNKRLRK